jgi:thioredoxin 1
MHRNILIVGLVVLLVGCVAWFKNQGTADSNTQQSQATSVQPAQSATTSQPSTKKLPRLVELGAGKCTACRKMKPIIEALRTEYAGRLQVDAIDVLEQEDEAKPFKWSLIPCQVFLDPEGKELWRHEGFIPKADILARWKELGYPLGEEPKPGA